MARVQESFDWLRILREVDKRPYACNALLQLRHQEANHRNRILTELKVEKTFPDDITIVRLGTACGIFQTELRLM